MPLTLANQITVLRIILIPLVATTMLYHRYGWALTLFVIAALSDAADGLVARRMNQTSSAGAMLDAVADMLLVSVLVIILVLIPEPMIGLPIWLVAIVIWRNVQMIMGIIILHMTHSRLHWRPLWVGKANTITMLILLGLTLFMNCLVVREVSVASLVTFHAVMVWAVFITTAISWYQYTILGFSLLHEERNNQRVEK